MNELTQKELKNMQDLRFRNFVVITANQEKLGDHWTRANIENTYRLADLLRVMNLDNTVCTGYYKGIAQGACFIIWDCPENVAWELARKFNQESILTNEGLLYADGRRQNRSDFVFGKQAQGMENYTRNNDGFCWSMLLNEEYNPADAR